MSTKLEHPRSDLLEGRKKTEEYIRRLVDQVNSLSTERDYYKEQFFQLKEAMKMREQASLQRIEAMRLNANAQLLEIKSGKMLEAPYFPQMTDFDESDYMYCGVIRPVQSRGEMDEDLYSNITTALAKEASDDVSVKSHSSLDEKIEVDVNSEPPPADSCAPPLPHRPKSIDSLHISALSLAARSQSSTDISSYRAETGRFQRRIQRKPSAVSKIIRSLADKTKRRSGTEDRIG